jgi:vacuolar-type H+-ATPase subunit F/Vma7
MSRVVAIGAPLELLGWTLAGVALIEASNPEQVRLAWSGLDADVGLAVLTPAAREALPARLNGPVLWAVLPS